MDALLALVPEEFDLDDAAAIVMVTAAVADPETAPVAVMTCSAAAAAVVGVPLMTPVLASMESPSGSAGLTLYETAPENQDGESAAVG